MGNELSLPYVPIDPRIERHPKTRKLLRALGMANDPFAHMHVVKFLMDVGALHPDGDLGNISQEDIADMARWSGDAKKFTDAMVDAGWILFGVGGYVVIGWEDYGGRVLKKREQWKEQQKQRRSRSGEAAADDMSGGCQAESGGHTPESGGVHDHKVKSEEVKSESELKEKEASDKTARNSLLAAQVAEVVAHHEGVFPRYRGKVKPGRETHRKVIARLREGFSVEDLKKAIDGNAASKFYCDIGKNELGFIAQSESRVIELLGAKDRPARVHSPPARGGVVGYHPGSPPEQFVNGRVNLSEV